MKTTPDKHIETHMRDTFREACANIDERSLRRLANARHEALHPASRSRSSRLLIPAGAVAASLLAFVVIWNGPGSKSSSGGAPSSQLAAMPVSDAADVEFFGDIEFYRWLAAQPNTTPTP